MQKPSNPYLDQLRHVRPIPRSKKERLLNVIAGRNLITGTAAIRTVLWMLQLVHILAATAVIVTLLTNASSVWIVLVAWLPLVFCVCVVMAILTLFMKNDG